MEIIRPVKPMSLEEYLIERQKRKDAGEFTFAFIEYVSNGTVISRVDFDTAYKSMVDITTNEDATTNKP